jgi:hypothetical protein
MKEPKLEDFNLVESDFEELSYQEKRYISRGTEIIFIVDSSPSMSALDIGESTRLQAAKDSILYVTQGMPETSFGLVAMATEAACLVPPSMDIEIFKKQLEDIKIGALGDGTALGVGISNAVYHLSSSASPQKAIVLITDGENNAGTVHPFTAAKLSAELKIPIYVLGLGTTGTVPVEYTDPKTGKTYSGYLESGFNSESLEQIAKITKAVSRGILAFRSVEGLAVQPDVSVLNTRINQSEVQTLQDFLCKKVEEALHIPNRETRGSSGDTGTAVENRAGYRALENIAGLVTLQARKAETKALDVILQICKTQTGCPFASLNINDIEIKANRNKVENLTTASNAYSTLRSAGLNDIDALNACELVPDAIGTASRNKAESEENQQRQLELAQQTAKVNEDSSEKKSEESDK